MVHFYLTIYNIGHKDRNIPNLHEKLIVKFTDIKGIWFIENGEVFLTDESFENYRVYEYNNESQNLKIEFEDFQFGIKEKLNRGEICMIDGDKIIYKQ